MFWSDHSQYYIKLFLLLILALFYNYSLTENIQCKMYNKGAGKKQTSIKTRSHNMIIETNKA